MNKLQFLFFIAITATLFSCGNDDNNDDESEDVLAFTSCCGENPYSLINVDNLNTGITGFGMFTPNGDLFNDNLYFSNSGIDEEFMDLSDFIPNNVKVYDSENNLMADIDNYSTNEDELFSNSNYNIEAGVYRYRVVIGNQDDFLLQGYSCAILEPTPKEENCSAGFFDPLLQ